MLLVPPHMPSCHFFHCPLFQLLPFSAAFLLTSCSNHCVAVSHPKHCEQNWLKLRPIRNSLLILRTVSVIFICCWKERAIRILCILYASYAASTQLLVGFACRYIYYTISPSNMGQYCIWSDNWQRTKMRLALLAGVGNELVQTR